MQPLKSHSTTKTMSKSYSLYIERKRLNIMSIKANTTPKKNDFLKTNSLISFLSGNKKNRSLK